MVTRPRWLRVSDEPGPPSDDSEQGAIVQQVLGVIWEVGGDELILDISDIPRLMRETRPTKRSAVSLATRVYDPLGAISPITVRFKLLFQRLCEKGVHWDEPLTAELLAEWELLISDLQQFRPVRIPQCCAPPSGGKSYSLEGYCDASQRAYAAVVYLQTEKDEVTHNQFICSKTRVARKSVTKPLLEFLSALLLARLISAVRRALESEVPVDDVTSYRDSQVASPFLDHKRQRMEAVHPKSSD